MCSVPVLAGVQVPSTTRRHATWSVGSVLGWDSLGIPIQRCTELRWQLPTALPYVCTNPPHVVSAISFPG